VRDSWNVAAGASPIGTVACPPTWVTDFRADLPKFDVPTLVVHGDDDQVVPFEVGGKASAAMVEGARLVVYQGAPHGITDTHKEQLGADLLAFLREYGA
jgi:non-heme chloroperoxidase